MKKDSLESARRWTKVAKVLLVVLGLLFIVATALLSGYDSSLAQEAGGGGATSFSFWVDRLQDLAKGLIGVVAVVMIISGGVVYATSQGNPNQIGVARDMIVSAIAGVALFMFATWLLGDSHSKGSINDFIGPWFPR